MVPPPPWLVRRLVLDPAVVVLCLVVVAVAPLALAVAAPLGAARRSRVPVAVVRVVAAFAIREALGVVALTGLWIVCGCGLLLRRRWAQDAHYRVIRWWIDGPLAVAQEDLCLRLRLESPPLPPTAVVVLARHAGMGDSLLLVRALLDAGRRPRLVVQQALLWDPCVDLVGHRVPMVFVPVRRSRRRQALPAIARLARDVGDDDAVVIFPEGGNFSPPRHRRAVDSLRRRGEHMLADRASRLRHVLPPKTDGVQAILREQPDLPVVIAAHSGLEHLVSVAAVLHNIPLRHPVVLRWELTPPDGVPRQDRQVVDWLFGRWEEMDRWIGSAADAAAYPVPAPAPRQCEGARRTTPGALA